MQAVALLTQATQAAPNSAVAWGSLALAYAVRKRTSRPCRSEPASISGAGGSSEKIAGTQTARSAGTSARSSCSTRLYRHGWRSSGPIATRFERTHRSRCSISIISDMLGNVGRWKDAPRSRSKRMDRQHFLDPGADVRFITDLWAAGDIRRPTKRSRLGRAMAAASGNLANAGSLSHVQRAWRRGARNVARTTRNVRTKSATISSMRCGRPRRLSPESGRSDSAVDWRWHSSAEPGLGPACR